MGDIIKCRSKNQIKPLVEKYNLDKRYKYSSFNGMLIIDGKTTRVCSGCEGCGCFECGYKGKRIDYFPIPIFKPKKITSKKHNSLAIDD